MRSLNILSPKNKIKILLLYFLFYLFLLSTSYAQPKTLPVLCYHDIVNNGNSFAVSPQNLQAQFEYLQKNGYTVISLAQYEDAVKNNMALPEKPIMLTFDDGYKSMYTTVYPLLRQYHYPAMSCVITSWIDDSGNLALKSSEIREMASSGLVTFASHTFLLHNYKIIDKNGHKEPITAGYTSYSDGKYQSKYEYQQQIANDMKISQHQLHALLGYKIAAIVWPYGAYTEENIDLAFKAGYDISFTFGSKANILAKNDLRHVQRFAIMNNPDIKQFAAILNNL